MDREERGSFMEGLIAQSLYGYSNEWSSGFPSGEPCLERLPAKDLIGDTYLRGSVLGDALRTWGFPWTSGLYDSPSRGSDFVVKSLGSDFEVVPRL